MDEHELPPSLATPSLREVIAAQPGAQRLLSAVQLADSFELEIVACPTPLHAKALIAWLSERLPDPQPVCHLAARRSDATNRVGMEEIARDILGPLSSASGHRPVYLDASAAHLDEHAAWRWMFHRLNERRNALAATLSSPLIMLLPRWLEPVLPAEAPDLWSIRSVTIELPGNEPVRREQDRVEPRSSSWIEDLEDLHRQVEVRRDRANSGSMADRTAYAAALRRYVNAALGRVELEELRRRVDEELIPLAATLDDALERARALRTQAAVRAREGDTNAALEILQSLVLPIVENDNTEYAATLGEIANVLENRGELDESLRIRREDQLPIFERIGDVRSMAVTTMRIADILRERGELDEALRLFREEALPLFERFGDVRLKAVTMGKISDILRNRGELDEASRILRDEVLPVFERLNDLQATAVTMGKISDILQARGELDEALRILREEVLPVFDHLGDVRAKAVTMRRVANILWARGEFDEALRILREEALPIFESFGDVRTKAVALGEIAALLQARGDLDEALRILREEVLPIFARLGDAWSTAVTMLQSTTILRARGEFDEALRILREEVLPVFEHLGDVRSKMVTMEQIADILQERGDLDETLRIRHQ